MKPLMLVPPAQAEALSDTQEDLRGGLPLDDHAPPVPWRGDDILEEPLSYLKLLPPDLAGRPLSRMPSFDRVP